MPSTHFSATEISTLEDKVAKATSFAERIIYQERLVRVCMYVTPLRAHSVLTEMRKLHEGEADALPFFYYLHRANLASLEYDDDLALSLLEKAVVTVDQYGDITEKIEVYLDYVGVLINHGRQELARDYFDKAEKMLESYPHKTLRARALVREGFLYVHSFSYPKATPKFLEADRIFSKLKENLSLKDHYFYTLLHSGLGTLQMRPGNLDKAAASFRKAISRCEAKGLLSRLAWHQLKLANTLAAMQEFDGAIENFNAIIESNAHGSQQALAGAHLNLGMCLYTRDGQADKVTPLLDQAERLFLASPNPERQQLVSIEITRAQLVFDRGDYEGTIDMLTVVFSELNPDANFENLPIMGHTAEICQMLAECYALAKDFETAYNYRLLYDFYLVKYNSLEDARQQEEFAARFETAAWEKERESLQLRASQLQLRALRAQMNPHFLFNAMNSIQSFITTNEASTASRYLAKFAMLMRRSLEYSNLEYISLEDEVQFLTDYLEINCQLRFGGNLKYVIELSPDLEEDFIGVPTMILQPYVENAIEHGLRSRQSGNVRVLFVPDEDDDNSIIATVTDDGIGREQVAIMHAADATRDHHQSRGTSITQSRLELLSDSKEQRVLIEDLYHEDGKAAGTRVTVRIPVVDVVPRRLG